MISKPKFETVKTLNFLDACDYVEQEIGIPGWADNFSDEIMSSWEVSNDSYRDLFFIDGLEFESDDMQTFCKVLGITEKDKIILLFSW